MDTFRVELRLWYPGQTIVISKTHGQVHCLQGTVDEKTVKGGQALSPLQICLSSS